MLQEYWAIMPTSDRALKYIDRFGSEKLRYQTLQEAISHYKEFKRILIPDIGIARVTCYSCHELNKLIHNKGMGTIPKYKDDSVSDDTETELTIDDLREREETEDD